MPNRTPTPARPVFVDRSGRRRRLTAMIGAALGVALVATLAAFAVGLSSGSPLSIPGLPAIGGQVEPDTTTSPDAHSRTLPPAGRPSTSATASSTEPTPTPTLRRRVPTHTPPHTPKPK